MNEVKLVGGPYHGTNYKLYNYASYLVMPVFIPAYRNCAARYVKAIRFHDDGKHEVSYRFEKVYTIVPILKEKNSAMRLDNTDTVMYSHEDVEAYKEVVIDWTPDMANFTGSLKLGAANAS